MEMIPAVVFAVVFLAMPVSPEKGPWRVVLNFTVATVATAVAIGLMLCFGCIDDFMGINL